MGVDRKIRSGRRLKKDEISSLVGTTFLYTLIAGQDLGKSQIASFVYIPLPTTDFCLPPFPNDTVFSIFDGISTHTSLAVLKCLWTWIIRIEYREKRLFPQTGQRTNSIERNSPYRWVITVFFSRSI